MENKIVYPTQESVTKFFRELREGWEKAIILIRQGTSVSESIVKSYIQKHPFKTVEEIIKIINNEYPRAKTI